MLMIHKSLKSNRDSYSYWSDRIVQVRLKLSRGYLTVLCIYAPNEGKEEESETFYNTLQQILNKTNKSEMITIMGDFNARVGNTKIHNNIGYQGENTCNRNGKRTDRFFCI
jgi:exonuclease III